MSPQARIVELSAKKLVGISKQMSRMNDMTPRLWRSFMPRRSEVLHRATQDYMSMQVFPDGAKQVADAAAVFAKWAVVEVSDYQDIPEGMASYDLAGGLYAMFIHNGPATDLSTIMYIFTEWLPGSVYELDDREHFEVLPQDYSALDPNAREEIWVPLRLK